MELKRSPYGISKERCFYDKFFIHINIVVLNCVIYLISFSFDYRSTANKTMNLELNAVFLLKFFFISSNDHANVTFNLPVNCTIEIG